MKKKKVFKIIVMVGAVLLSLLCIGLIASFIALYYLSLQPTDFRPNHNF